MRCGWRLDDLGVRFTWADLKDFIEHLPPSGDSALFRAQHPRTWWWTPMFDFLAAILLGLQQGNWQRGGGKGPKPEPVKRPAEKRRSTVHTDPVSAADLAAKKARIKKAVSSVR